MHDLIQLLNYYSYYTAICVVVLVKDVSCGCRVGYNHVVHTSIFVTIGSSCMGERIIIIRNYLLSNSIMLQLHTEIIIIEACIGYKILNY